MIIKRIYLKGYKPLALNNIQSIQIDIQSNLTLILGTNGSGKSSLLKELHPFPAVPANYEAGGEKRIEIEHNQNHYVLISILGHSGKHTLIKNGIEIHKHATASLHTEVILKEFQYSLLAHRLLIGEIRFTDLSPQERRDLLTTISPLDLRYAIKLHASIKEQVRDQSAIVKHLTQKSADAKLKLRELNVTDGLIERRAELESLLNALIPFAAAGSTDVSTYLYQLDDIEAKLGQLKIKMGKIKDSYLPNETITDIVSLNEYLGICSGHITAAQTNINNANVEIENLTQLTNSLINNTLTHEEIAHHIEQLEGELKSLPDNCFVDSNHDTYLEALANLIQTLETIFEMDDGITYYDKEQRDQILQTEVKLKQEIAYKQTTLISYQSRLKHLLENDTTFSCPKCQHQFRTGSASPEETIETIQRLVQTTEESIKSLEDSLDKHQVHVHSVQLHQQMVILVQNLKRSSLLPVQFWDQFESNTDVVRVPTRTRNFIELWKTNIATGAHRFTVLTELKSYHGSLKLFNQYGGAADKRVIELQQLIHHEFNTIDHYMLQLQETKQLLQTIQQYEECLKQSESLLERLDQVTKEAVDVSIRHDAKQRCDQVYHELGETAGIIAQQNHLTQSIVELEADLAQSAKNQKMLTVLEENLSQTKGIIADQMLGYVENYIEQMNDIIASVWEYPLKLIPCDMDNGNMSYIFPVQVSDSLVPDIKHMSKGQSEIIDLAFIMVMRSYLNICQYPIYFDETGATFDDLHRLALLKYIKEIIDTSQCSQVFMVNHYAVWNTSFTNHDVIVLDHRNITIPDQHNENVVIVFKED